MPHGEHPNLKREKGVLKRFCETCKREMNVINKCEKHNRNEREPCYYCHLMIQHFIRDKGESSQKKTLKPVT